MDRFFLLGRQVILCVWVLVLLDNHSLVDLDFEDTAGLEPWCPRLFCSAGVQEFSPGKRFKDGGDLSEHYLHHVSDCLGGVLGVAGAFQAPVDKELQEIEGQRPQKQDGQEASFRA